MLNVRKIKPMGSKVLVTKNLYGWDDVNEAGILLHQKGDLKFYQEVISVGKDVTFVSPGDQVAINFYKYAVFKEDPNSVKAIADNPVVGFRLEEVDLVDTEGDPITCLLIDQRDVQYILEDFDEYTCEKKSKLVVEKPKKKLILPDSRIKV